jgi:NAD(P)-dependent dehydrogenase (short-subunit alcohol dehydrogenase family)
MVMSAFDLFRYDGKTALVVGGATGMGAATAQAAAAAGATVVVMDHAPVEFPVDRTIAVDLQDPASIDAALETLDGPVDALFSAAGIGDGLPAVMRVNFIGHRHLITRLVESGRLVRGSAVCMISSVAGLGWQNHLDQLLEFLATPDYESAVAWVDAHEGTNTYSFSKQAMNAYVAWQAYPFMAEGIRINSICPGPTDTPLARANSWGGFASDYREATGLEQLQPEQMAAVMVFLNSAAASGISGVSLLVDSGHVMSSITGSFAPGKPVIDFVLSM